VRSALRGGLPSEPDVPDRGHCKWLALVYATIASQPDAQDTQRVTPGVEAKSSGRYLFAAILAIAEFAAAETGQGGCEALALRAAPRAGGLCHRLLLDRVHAAETADGLLIEHYGSQAFCTQHIFLRQLCQSAFDPFAEFIQKVRGQSSDPAFVIGRRPLSVV